jgi:L-tyrosine isonitrile synthase
MSIQKSGDGSDAIADPPLQELGLNHSPVGFCAPDLSPSGNVADLSGRSTIGKRPRRKPGRPNERVPPDKVLHAFNTWAFKREQPDDQLTMLKAIARSIAVCEPIPFVLYWGKGPRNMIGAPETECLGYIAALVGRIRDVYTPGAAVKLIFTDTHAELNGHSHASIVAYFAAVEACARDFGIEHCWMSHLTNSAPAIPEMLDDPMPDDDILQRLATSAAKWYHGSETPQQAALAYYKINMVEKRAVEIAFPHSIFITFNGSRLRVLFPQHLPIFYMYSLRRGFSVKPWFVVSDSER